MRGNIFQSEIERGAGELPENLFAGRLVCRCCDSFRTAAQILKGGSLNTEAALLIRTAAAEGKPEFLQAWNASEYRQNSILLVENRELGSDLSGLVFYPKSLLPTDAFFRAEDGDILDFQIPDGKMSGI